MQPDEIVVARLNQGATLVRYVDRTSTRVTLALGRNRQAKLPADRVLYATGALAADHEDFERFRSRVEESAASIDLAELWEVVAGERGSMSLIELAELYYGERFVPMQAAALALRLGGSDEFFTPNGGGHKPRSAEEVNALRERRRRQSESELAARTLMAALAEGRLPSPSSTLQEQLLVHLREYAAHGDDYARAHTAHALLRDVAAGARDMRRRCFELLVGAGVYSEDEPLELRRSEIEERMPPEAEAEADAVRAAFSADAANRADLTALEAFTIDDAHTRDRDDALSIEQVEGGYRVGVHIADAGSLVPPGGAMDDEAGRRMASLYLPERALPMLPERFAAGVSSLDPDRERLAISLLATFDAAGEMLRCEITPSLVRSREAISYEEADALIAAGGGQRGAQLRALSALASLLLSRRERAGAINVNRAEMIIRASGPTDISVRVVQRSTPSRDLVTEMMTLFNTTAARYCRDNDIPAAYRSQSAPDLSGIDAFDDDGIMRPLNRIEEYRLMRRFEPAVVSVAPAQHAGLGADAYLQVTSPLRRYLDLVMQRQIGGGLRDGKPPHSAEQVSMVAKRAETQLREMARIEEQRRRYWFLKHLMLTRLGAPDGADLFPAYVLDRQPRQLALLELDEFPFRARAELPSGIEPATRVTLQLTGVDLWRRQAHFLRVPDAPPDAP